MIDTYSVFRGAKSILARELKEYARNNTLVDRNDEWLDGEAEMLAENILAEAIKNVTLYPYSELNKNNVR